MEEFVAVCHDCEWEQPMPQQDMAAHAKRVHEDRHGHRVTIDT